MHALTDEFPISVLCQLLHAAPSGYYRWRRQQPSQRSQTNAGLMEAIRRHFVASEEIYGSPRILADLREEGMVVNHKRVERLMRANGIIAHTAKKFKGLTKRTPGRRAAPNLVNQRFVAKRPNQIWLVDSTEFDTHEGTLYLAVVEDLFSRRVVGWRVGNRFTTALVLAALKDALLWRRPEITTVHALIHHSDQGGKSVV